MAKDVPSVTILLLGDEGVGKSTFLSRLALGANARDDSLPPYTLPTLRDLDQPFIFNISFSKRTLRFEFSDTASPNNYTLIKPDFIILCYDISRRETWTSLKDRWGPMIQSHFNYDEALPVMVLGLKRDLRREWTTEEQEQGFGATIMPQEGLLAAQEMRADRYAECSALTGELCREVLEDLALIAAKTQTDDGGKSVGGCQMM